MKLAFCLFNYFPYGGLQRDFLRIARECFARQHEIHVYTMHWEGEKEDGFIIHLIKPNGWQNHTQAEQFVQQVQHLLAKENYDLVVGFNKMPGLDVYYAADVCYQARVKSSRHPFYRLLPRYRRFKQLEAAVFTRDTSTRILLISPKQQQEYTTYYQTESERFVLLPPGIAKDRVAGSNASKKRQHVRQAHHIAEDELLLLAVGSGFKTKGLDRTLYAIAALPEALRERSKLYVIGSDRAQPFQKLAEQLAIEDKVLFLGGCDNVPDYLLAADLLLHPAYHENTGTVLLEALVAGLPVLTVDVCGYSPYIAQANAGHVLSSPFEQADFNEQLKKILLASDARQEWKQNALRFSQAADLYSLPEKAATLIDEWAKSP
jgi:UDP-glucose:(heptosyl)LPS alpha-1,3-glucosyltransferase